MSPCPCHIQCRMGASAHPCPGCFPCSSPVSCSVTAHLLHFYLQLLLLAALLSRSPRFASCLHNQVLHAANLLPASARACQGLPCCPPGTTLDIIGVAPVFTDPLKVLMAYVSRDKLAHDIQFRGAISDFHPIKNAVLGADYDPLMLRSNPDDVYGDGNNFEVCTAARQSASLLSWQRHRLFSPG